MTSYKSRMLRSFGPSFVLAALLGMSTASCIGPVNTTKPTTGSESISSEPTSFHGPSTGDASGDEVKGGLRIVTNKNGQLPLRQAGFVADARGDARTLRYPPWLLFHSRGKGSLSFEVEWYKSKKDPVGDPWAGGAIAFHEAWTAVDASQAKYLVLWAQMSDPTAPIDLAVALHAVTKKKGKQDTGFLRIADYARGRKIGKTWTKVVIPLAAFPDIDKVDLKELQTIRLDMRGNPPKDQRTAILLDNVYFTDAGLVTPVSNLGYLVRGDGVLMLWDKAEVEGIKSFDVQLDGKSVAKAGPNSRLVLVPKQHFPDETPRTIAIVTVGEGDRSDPAKIQVVASQPAEQRATVTVEAATSHKVSPYLFGANWAIPKTIEQIRPTIVRWGGARTSKYNWEYDVDSAGNEDYFLNGISKRRGAPEKDKAYFNWIKKTLDAGTEINFTIPIGPWIAKAHNEEGEQYCSFPREHFKQQQAWHPEVDDCGNGIMPDGETLIWGNDPNWSMVPNSPEHQKGLVENIKKLFGGVAKKTVTFYSLDNEPGLWNSVHRDTVPKGISAKDLVDLNVKYAAMIKSVEPAAQVIGYSAWSAVDLAGSNMDYTPPGKDGYKFYGEFEDPSHQWSERKQNGNRSQFEYYLDEMKAAEAKAGKRLIDVVDIHWFPYAYGVDANGEMQRLSENLPFDPLLAEQQFEAVREWYDPTYENSSSWMADEENKEYLWDPYHPVIPALKKTIAERYPGTKLAINDFDTGSREHYHGGLIRGAVMGIFMQEDVYMAAPFAQDNEGATFVYLMQKLYSNYDDKGGAVRGNFHKSQSTSKDLMSFAVQDGKQWKIVLINRNRKERVLTTVALPSAAKTYRTYIYGQTLGFRLLPTEERKAGDSRFAFYVPAYSAALLVAE
jgi:hypothetical protein